DVVHDQVPVGVQHRAPLGDERRELLVVGVGALDGLGEDRRVARPPPDPVGHQPAQGAVAEVHAGQVVQPGALAVAVVKLVQLGHRALLVVSSAATWSRGTSGSVRRLGSTGWPAWMRVWMGSTTSQTPAFMPATTRCSLSQKARNWRVARSPRTTTRSQVAAKPEYSMARSYWSE